MDVKHGGDRHVDVVGAQQRLARMGRQGAQFIQGVQHQLTVAEIDPLGIPRGTRGVEQGRHRILVKIGEVELVVRPDQQRLVLPEQGQCGGRQLPIGQPDIAAHRGQLLLNALQHGQEVVMNQHQMILGVVHGEGDLLRREAHVHRVQHGAYHGHGEEAFEGAVTVPVQQGDRVPRPYARGRQQVGETVDPLIEGAIVIAQPICVDDLPVRVLAHPG
ncbi:hypothetical protein D3C85_980970 [compost metagenome]